MSYSRSPSNNRLLALEQELLEKKRLAEECQSRQKINHIKQDKTRIASKKRYTNNRLLQLEQELLGRYSSKKPKKKISGAQTSRVERDNSDRVISHSNNRLLALEQELLGKRRKPKKRKPKSKRSRVKSQVFDTGEAIVLQYNSEAFPVTTPQKAAVSFPQEAEEVDKFEVKNSEPELPVVPEKVVSNAELSEDISQESANSLSQAAELISETDTSSYPLQAEDIPAILAELNNDRTETPSTPIAPQQESKSDREVPASTDRNNPHAIFDRMGKNMAYATAFDLGTIELEQLFDEFDRTLDREEIGNKGDSVAQRQSDRNLELEQRFDEFDRTLEIEEQEKDVQELSSPNVGANGHSPLQEFAYEQQVDKDDSVSQGQSDRNWELEQRFDEFDRALELEEQEREFRSSGVQEYKNFETSRLAHEQQVDKKDSVAQGQSDRNWELEQRFDEFDRALEIEEQKKDFKELRNPDIGLNDHLPLQEFKNSVTPATPATPLTPPKFDFKLEALLFRTGINLISLILWLLNLLRRKQIDWQSEIDSRSILSSFRYRDRGKNEIKNPNSQIIDMKHNDFTEEISPFILSSQRSTSLAKSTPIAALTPSRDPLTGMLDDEFTKQNSYPLPEEVQAVQEFTNYVTPATPQFLFEKSFHPPKEIKNDSS